MKAIAQAEIIALISDINAFADKAEALITSTKENYARQKNTMYSRHKSESGNLESSFQASCAAINRQSQRTLRDAKSILDEIIKLEDKLSAVDKYFVKTKKKREESLLEKTDTGFTESTDYFETLGVIQERFTSLYKKYAEDILPGLINGLNYLFSSQRKKDYEDLIILRNTVTAFVKEIEVELPQIVNEQIAAYRKDYLEKKGQLEKRQKDELEAFEEKYLITLDDVASEICADLDNILPDEFVEYLHVLMDHYNSQVFKVNSSDELCDDTFNMMFIDYPVDFFVQSAIVANTLREKCKSLVVDGSIRFPVAASVQDAPVWLILSDNSNLTAVQEFTHSVMFGYLSSVPVSKLLYSVFDPENHGNSISPFFDAKKKLPELFGNQIYISKNEIANKIEQLNARIENLLQDKIGTEYANIFDYKREHGDYDFQTELLTIYDFPKGFDERTLNELRNILRNGAKCGIYVLIHYQPSSETTYSSEYQKNVQSVLDLSTIIQQENSEFVFRGLPLTYYVLPEKKQFGSFFGKYMLIYEGIKNRGIAFSPLIKQLVDSRDSMDLDSHISRICAIMAESEKKYGTVPSLGTSFPTYVILGSVLYPADIFSDSVAYKKICKTFGYKDVTATEAALVELPLVFDLRKNFNLFLNSPESSNDAILLLTHHVAWSLLSAIPVSGINICIFDGEKRGNSVIPFLEFRKACPDVFDQKIYTSSEDMMTRLQKLNDYIDEFIQEKLGNRYHDILDYNQNTSTRSEAITLLIIYDFPKGMDGRSIDLLTNIIRNGNKCGVYTMICYNPDISFSRYENIDERLEVIHQYSTSIEYKSGHYHLLPYNLTISTLEPLSACVVDKFIEEYVEKSEAIKKQGLSFKDILQPELFTMNSAKSLSIPVGIGDGDSIVSINVGVGSSHHGLIAGATGSGKSTLLHTMIMSSMLHYSPDQLHLYLMDFKSGTEFKVYESVKLPHIQLLALDAMQEFGESILENLVTEMENRAKAFKDDANGVTKIKDYVELTGKPMPRIVVIMDEFQILFNDSTNRKVAMHCAELTKRIVTEGRSFGIHLFMATQSTRIISDLTLSSGTVEQMRIRVGLKCGENDARYLFGDQNDMKALAMMKGPIGTAVLNQDYTEQPNIGFRVAYCDDETQKYYLDLISKTYADRASTLQTFEGNRTTNLLDYFAEANIGVTSELPVQIHMGTLIKVAPPFSICIDKKKKHNLLICGANEKMANTISNNYMISALLNRNATVYCIDGDKLIGDDSSANYYSALAECSAQFKVAQDRADIIHFINEIYQNYQSWKKQNSDDVIFVVIKNLQFLDIVKSMFKGDVIDESEYVDKVSTEPEFNPADPFAAVNTMFASRDNDDNMAIGEKLVRLIEDGSGFGIHFVVTSLEYQPVRECMYYGENILAKFPERIIFSLGSNDADSLIENVSVTGLRDNTVYFTDGVKNIFQMKPYISPSPCELKRLFD